MRMSSLACSLGNGISVEGKREEEEEWWSRRRERGEKGRDGRRKEKEERGREG